MEVNRSEMHFNQRIESLRGLAALAVAITHSVAVFHVDGLPNIWVVPFADQPFSVRVITLVITVFNAEAAVILFFVISGYVLALSIKRSGAQIAAMPSYLARRAFRLFPAMWVSIAVFWLITHAVRPDSLNGFTAWFISVFGSAPSVGDALRNLLLLDFRSNPVTWTMLVEVVGSFCIPALVFIAVRFGRGGAALAMAALTLLAAVAYPNLVFTYLFCFCAGVVFASFPITIPMPGLALFVGFTLFMLERGVVEGGLAGLLVNALGSCLILAAVLCGRNGTAFLEWRPIRFLGRISYSVYLIHLPLIYIVAIALKTMMSADGLWLHLATAILAIPLTIAVAAIMYSLIEVPSIRAGRSLSSKLVPREP